MMSDGIKRYRYKLDTGTDQAKSETIVRVGADGMVIDQTTRITETPDEPTSWETVAAEMKEEGILFEEWTDEKAIAEAFGPVKENGVHRNAAGSDHCGPSGPARTCSECGIDASESPDDLCHECWVREMETGR